MVLSRSVMELGVVSEDSQLLQILEAHAEDLLSKRHAVAGLPAIVESQLIGVLPSGNAQAALIAKQLGMSVRSLRRHLAQEGASFGEILDGLRKRLALHYLADAHVSLKQIAWLLGYSDLGAFNHAFKRWTGSSPGRARNRESEPGQRRVDFG